MSVHAHVRIVDLMRQARGAGLSDAESLLRVTRLDWDEAWDAWRAGGYLGVVPRPDIDRLLRAAELFDAAGFPVLARTANAIVAQIEEEKDRAASARSALARHAAKPGSASGRINRTASISFAELSQPNEGGLA